MTFVCTAIAVHGAGHVYSLESRHCVSAHEQAAGPHDPVRQHRTGQYIGTVSYLLFEIFCYLNSFVLSPHSRWTETTIYAFDVFIEK